MDSRPKAASQVDGSWEINVMQKLAGGSSQTAGAAKQVVLPSLPGYNLSKNVVGGPLVRQTFGSDYGPETYNVGVSFCLKGNVACQLSLCTCRVSVLGFREHLCGMLA